MHELILPVLDHSVAWLELPTESLEFCRRNRSKPDPHLGRRRRAASRDSPTPVQDQTSCVGQTCARYKVINRTLEQMHIVSSSINPCTHAYESANIPYQDQCPWENLHIRHPVGGPVVHLRLVRPAKDAAKDLVSSSSNSSSTQQARLRRDNRHRLAAYWWTPHLVFVACCGCVIHLLFGISI